MAALIGNHWHHLSTDEVVDLLESNREKGLDLFDVANRKERFGANQLTGKKGKGHLIRFLLQLHQPLVYILIAAAITTTLLREWVDAVVIFGVVIVNACIGFIQEAKAVKAIDSLAKIMTTEATVLRAGEKHRISSTELVPGDIILLSSGDKTPTDMRLIKARNLQVDESALTGESAPVDKRPDTLNHDTVLADRSNMLYASTLVTYGQGVGIAVAIGDQTEVGRISRLISSAEKLETPLTRKIASFSHILLYVILTLASITFAVGLMQGSSAFYMFMAAVALAVGAIPEGLPAAITITLAIGVNRMARLQAIIRKLPVVETLGGTTVICSDKTGTLTENKMTVLEIAAGGDNFKITGVGYSPSGLISKEGNTVNAIEFTALTECLKAGMLCNESRLLEKDGHWEILGDATEGALLVSARKGGLNVTDQKELPRIDLIPFESQHQYMATLHDRGTNKADIIYAKGSVESILLRSVASLNAKGQPVVLDAAEIHNTVAKMATKGLRVLAFARGEFKCDSQVLFCEDVVTNMTFLGLQGMMDPPRPESANAIKSCHKAGILVKMITGDHHLTASAIAQQIGLHNSSHVVTGKSLDEMSDQQLIDKVDQTAVFARVTPEQKLRLVKALQFKGNIVAMTGDGVNDAPALKSADIGVAMGISGTDVAKEAADMVLTNDNFASIEAAVEEGRSIFDNLTKFIVWTLPTNLGEGLVILVAILAGITLPILPVQILWINMTTAVLLGLMLAFEPKEPNIMTRPPRDPMTPIITGILIWRTLMMGILLLAGAFGLYEWEMTHGASTKEARTVAVNVFVMVEIFYLLNCRSLTRSAFRIGFFSNPWIFSGIAIMLLLQVLYTYTPLMNIMFHSAPISFCAWGRILSISSTTFLLVEVEKWLRSRNLVAR